MSKANPTAAEKKAAEKAAAKKADEKKASDQAAANKAAVKDASSKDPKSLPPIDVRCATGERFCRAGRCFGNVNERVTDYTPEQLDAWMNEDQLIVSLADADAAK